MSNTLIKVSDIIAETLEQLGITTAFGIIGAGNVHLFESIEKRGYTQIICVHHEQAATMAMQTYFRTSGKLAACLLTTGGGSTNGVTGVVSAWADSIPGLVIAGNENSKFTLPHSPIRMWGVQGYDSVNMMEKVVKYSHRVIDPTTVTYEIKKSAWCALNDRPGPVWLEIPMDIQSKFIDPDTCLEFSPPTSISFLNKQLTDQIDAVITSLKSAERPVLWLGHGIRLAGAIGLIEPLIAKLKIPVLVSWAGLDMVNSHNPYVFGRAGVYGQRCANFVLQNSDYVLTIGTRLALPQIGYNLDELARDAEIDVVDIDPIEATKNKPRVREAIICDAGEFIDLLMNKIDTLESKNAWLNKCNEYRNLFPWVSEEHNDAPGYINSYRFMERLNKVLKSDQIIVTDMGTALLCSHQVLKLHLGQRLMTSTGLGEMGYGLPGAIGASIATNNGEVLCLNCDGGMMMNLQELQTIVHHNLPIKIIVFNNDGYLMIKHTQNALFKANNVGVDRRTGVSCPDFNKIATAFDIPSYQIKSWDECDQVLNKMQETTGPVLVEVFMHPKQLFSPKLGMHMKNDGSLVSSPLEDLGPLIPRDLLEKVMITEIHEKSKSN